MQNTMQKSLRESISEALCLRIFRQRKPNKTIFGSVAVCSFFVTRHAETIAIPCTIYYYLYKTCRRKHI